MQVPKMAESKHMNGHANGHAHANFKPQPQEDDDTSIKPIAELARLHRPAGALLIYFPCLYGTLFLASMLDPMPSPAAIALLNGKLLLGSSLVRFLGCTWNDIVDQDVDKQVARTRSRPLARGAVRTREAVLFAIAQLAVGVLLTCAMLPQACLVWGTPSMLLTVLYPYGKSFTNYPQLILGLVFSWGIVLAVPAFEVEESMLQHPNVVWAQMVLYGSCVAWTVLYDTIYAAQDISDDTRLGLHSTMTAHERNARNFLRMIAFVQCTGLIATAFLAQASWVYCTGLVSSISALAYMVEKVDLERPSDCGWWFTVGNIRIAMVMGCMFAAEYASRRYHLGPLGFLEYGSAWVLGRDLSIL